MSNLTEWLAGLPTVVLFLGFAAFGIALTVLLDVFFRRRMKDQTRTEAGRTAAIARSRWSSRSCWRSS